MPTEKVEAPQTVRSLLARDPEIKEVARRFAALALVYMEPDGLLNIRQLEQLRRGMATAAEPLAWNVRTATSDNPVMEVTGDVLKLSKGGAKAMEKDLADELERKKVELDQITATADVARTLSEDEDAEYPAEISYFFTGRNATGGLITKTDTFEPTNAVEALKIATNIEKTLPSKTKLNALMVIDLKEQQVQLAVMTKALPEFVKSTHDLMRDVIVNLQ